MKQAVTNDMEPDKTQKYILALDLGSSGVRSLLVAIDGHVPLTEASRRYRVHRPQSNDALIASYAPQDLWRRVAEVLHENWSAAGLRPENIAAVSITSQRQGVAFLAVDGTPIYVGPNTDLRAVFEGASIDDRLADDIHASTGHLPSFFFTPAKLLWWAQHHPRLFRRIRRVLTLGGWIGFQLTGEQADVPSSLNEAGLTDLITRRPTPVLNELGIDPAILPPIVDEGATLGGLSTEAATLTGLKTGTPVVLTGPDSQAALLGMGIVSVGDIGIVSGWSTPVQSVTASPVLDPRHRTWTGNHLVPDTWVAEANVGDTGGTLDMVRRLLGPRASFERLDKLVSQARLGSNLVTAFWGPQALDLSSPGISMGGLLSPVPITFNTVHAGHVIRATLENIAYAIREGTDWLAELTGHRQRIASLSGGLAQSRVFPQLLADVLNTPVRLHHHRASSIGAAIAATVPRQQWAAAAQEAKSAGSIIEPDIRSAVDYQDLYERWLRLKLQLNAMTNEL